MLDSALEVGDVPTTLEQLLPSTSRHERSAVMCADERSRDEASLGTIWEQLEWGALEIVDDFVTIERCYLIVRQREGRAMTKMESRGVLVLKRVLVEGCQKVAAMELGIAPSTATALGRTGLLAIGLRCRVQNTPYIVAVAANASHEGPSVLARSSALQHAGGALQVLSIPRPETHVHHLFSRAVLEVTGSLLEGKTRSHIALARNRSERTVANQLAVAFRQLRAFSRLDMLRVLARSQGALAAISRDGSSLDLA